MAASTTQEFLSFWLEHLPNTVFCLLGCDPVGRPWRTGASHPVSHCDDERLDRGFRRVSPYDELVAPVHHIINKAVRPQTPTTTQQHGFKTYKAHLYTSGSRGDLQILGHRQNTDGRSTVTSQQLSRLFTLKNALKH